MIESLLGLLAIVALAGFVLVYLEVIDLTDVVTGLISLIGSALRLIAGFLFAVTAFFVWLVKRSGREKQS
jgi:hypothetical protein